jgi:hypothetical protein
MAKIVSDEEIRVLKQTVAETQIENVVPAGYLAIELSTEGHMGAPKKFHMRNFKTTDLLALSLTEDVDLPETIAKMLDEMIFEDDVSVKDFHEKEITELLVRLYMLFFSAIVEDAKFEILEQDFDFLESTLTDEAYKQVLVDLDTGNWVPRTSIDLRRVETYPINPDTFKTEITVRSKRTGMEMKFTYPRFGDVIVIKKFIKNLFEKEEKQFASIKRMIEYRNEMEKKYKEGKPIDIQRIPTVPQAEIDRVREFEIRKAMVAVDAVRALHLKSFDGEDLSKASLEDRIECVRDPRMDHNVAKKVEEFYTNLTFGLDEENVPMYNPVTKADDVRRFSFRFVDLLQAIKSSKSDEYDVIIDD